MQTRGSRSTPRHESTWEANSAGRRYEAHPNFGRGLSHVSKRIVLDPSQVIDHQYFLTSGEVANLTRMVRAAGSLARTAG
jgi:hypothetical protein